MPAKEMDFHEERRQTPKNHAPMLPQAVADRRNHGRTSRQERPDNSRRFSILNPNGD
jgi:hypothetical protein